MGFITFNSPRSSISESYRTLHTNIHYMHRDTLVRTILITSACAEEGKSTTAVNLAVVSAQAGKKTLLIDTDLRKPTIHHYFHEVNVSGLTNILSGQEIHQSIKQTMVEGLDLLPSGPIPPNPTTLLGSLGMAHLMRELPHLYDVIILDTPPVTAVTDAQLLASLVDGVVLVIRVGKTDKNLIRKAKQQLDHVNANIIGVVLNDKSIDDKHDAYYDYESSK